MVYKRGAVPAELKDALEGGADSADPEKGAINATNVGDIKPSDAEKDAAADNLQATNDIFTWRNVNYDVLIKGETRRLLNDVSGFVAPGKMTALMGECESTFFSSQLKQN